MQDEHAAYDEFDDYDAHEHDERDSDVAYYPPERRRVKRQPESRAIVPQALDWGFSGSILAILVLTAIYLFSPVDFIPDLMISVIYAPSNMPRVRAAERKAARDEGGENKKDIKPRLFSPSDCVKFSRPVAGIIWLLKKK